MTWTCPVTLYGTIQTRRGPVPDAVPLESRPMTWGDLCRLLADWRVVEHKALAGAWSPVRLHTPRRAAASVECVGCLVLDVDDGTPLDAAEEVWKPWRYLIHTSYSHTLDEPRYRVVLPLSEPVDAEGHRRVWRWARERWPVVDRSAKDAARAYYLPGVASECAPREVRAQDDAPMLDPSACIPTPHRRTAPAATHCRHYAGAHRESEAERALRTDPRARRYWASEVGAEVVSRPVGEVARGARCPQCGDTSVWWLIDPDRATRARCHHLDSCGWTGRLMELM